MTLEDCIRLVAVATFVVGASRLAEWLLGPRDSEDR